MTKSVALLFGGQSAEHSVSVRSARKVHADLRLAGYDVTLIAIDLSGVWRLAPFVAEPRSYWPSITLLPGGRGQLLVTDNPGIKMTVDVVFPMLHGPYGEDGSVQGLCKLANLACVGANLLSSAICMDKDITKRLLRAAGIPTASSQTFHQGDGVSYALLVSKLGLPLIVKPANMGSSIGVSRVSNEPELRQALTHAFNFDDKVIIERFIRGREIECAVLLADDPFAAAPGEIIPASDNDVYSYHEKYDQHSHTVTCCPAELPTPVRQSVQVQAIAACKALEVDGMARVDFFIGPDGRLLVNEVNTLPGFTNISLFPKLMSLSGVSSSDLLERLIDRAYAQQQQAFERQQQPANQDSPPPMVQPPNKDRQPDPVSQF
ncbi:MAG: D-alanine--D-alanine ligase family protein [Burkholderiaceae bacterium]